MEIEFIAYTPQEVKKVKKQLRFLTRMFKNRIDIKECKPIMAQLRAQKHETSSH